MSELLCEISEDGIAEVTLNRPDKRNAVTPDLLDALTAKGLELRDHAGLRAVILRGAGDTFCAGMDVSVLTNFAADLEATKATLADQSDPLGNRFQRPSTVWSSLPVPVIAVCQGHVLGAGLQIALGADFRIAAPDAKMAILEAKWGMIPDMGISQSLPRLIGADRAKLLMMTGKMFSGDAALDMGLVTECSDTPLERARELAAELCDFSPDTLAGSKRLVDKCWTQANTGLALEADIQADLMGGAHQLEKVYASLQKRPAKFTSV